MSSTCKVIKHHWEEVSSTCKVIKHHWEEEEKKKDEDEVGKLEAFSQH